MSDSELQRIRRKVEAGERLTEDELRTLRDAAQAQPGPTLRLAVAHALINADEERTALPLLERLVRDFPRDLQSWLGLARAQFMLERTSEAEQSLKQALTLSPGDPEATKVLATIALQRGEVAKARQLIGDVLRADPFDDEAKLLRAELESGELTGAEAFETSEPPREGAVALRSEFARELVRALKAKGIVATTKGDALLLQPPGGGVARASLASLHGAYLQEGRPLAEALPPLVDGLIGAALGVPEKADALLTQVLPVLRPEGFEQVARGAARVMGPAGLWVFFVIEDPELVRYVPEGSLKARALSIDEVERIAFENLASRRAPVRPVRVVAGRLVGGAARGLFAVCEEDGHDGARLLTSTQRAVIEQTVGHGPWRVDLGRREAAILCREDDVRACAELEELQPEPDGIPGRFRLDADGTLSRIDAPELPRHQA